MTFFSPNFSLFRSFISLKTWDLSGLNKKFGLSWKQKGAAGMLGIILVLNHPKIWIEFHQYMPGLEWQVGNSLAAGLGKSFWITSQ